MYKGDIVQKGKFLLSSTQPFCFQMWASRDLYYAQATAARLRAEVDGTPLVFPEIVAQDPKLVHEETALYESRRADLEQSFQD